MRYLLLVSTLTLTACGSNEESATAINHSESHTSVETEPEMEHLQANSYDTEEVPQTDTEEAITIIATEEEVELPLGRLTGIIDTGSYKQAIIDNDGKIIRLKEGENWQGWTLTAIHREKIVISHDKKEHSLLLLGEFRSPQLTQTELDNKIDEQAQHQDDDKQIAPLEGDTQTFTEEQLTELRSRLLIGR